jgi:hypothetical protein
MRQFYAVLESTQRLAADERIDRIHDLRAAMATDDGFAKYVRSLKPKDRYGE